MSETRTLLNRIAAVRERLGHSQSLLMASEAATPQRSGIGPRIARKARATSRSQNTLDESLHQLSRPTDRPGLAPSVALSNRAKHVLSRCRDLVGQLRDLVETHPGTSESPIAAAHRRCTTMTQTLVRLAQCMPEGVSAQMRFCEGMEGLLDSIEQNATCLHAAIVREARAHDWIERLTHGFDVLGQGQMLAMDLFLDIATAIQSESQTSQAIHFLSVESISAAASSEAGHAWRLQFIASHALNTAQVIARVARHLPHYAKEPLVPIVAALLHDVGMVVVPFGLIAQPGQLTGSQLRIMESHAARSAEIIAQQIPKAGALADAIGQHHERLNGTGYPHGDRMLPPLARLLAVCDVYAAMLAPRPHRAALDPRTALTEIMLEAQRGALDREVVAALQQLGFYPTGTVVELRDGRVGVVVACQVDGREPNLPALPVIAVLMDQDGETVPSSSHVDCGVDATAAICRALPLAERRDRLGAQYPQLV